MDPVQYLGFASAFLTTAAYVPQVIRVWRTRSTEDISLATFLILILGISGWLIYGLFKADLPMILANGTTLLLAGIILWFKLRGDRASTAQ